jgi:hypothetical protein
LGLRPNRRECAKHRNLRSWDGRPYAHFRSTMDAQSLTQLSVARVPRRRPLVPPEEQIPRNHASVAVLAHPEFFCLAVHLLRYRSTIKTPLLRAVTGACRTWRSESRRSFMDFAIGSRPLECKVLDAHSCSHHEHAQGYKDTRSEARPSQGHFEVKASPMLFTPNCRVRRNKDSQETHLGLTSWVQFHARGTREKR